MDEKVLRDEVRELNRRFLLMCTRSTEQNVLDMSLKLNVPPGTLGAIRQLSTDQLDMLADSGRSLVQPTLDEQSLLRAVEIQCPATRTLFLSAGKKVGSGVAAN